jgi:DNA polymerase-1
MSPGAAAGTFYLVDAHALLFQVFHAIRGMTSPAGLPTNALFGFTRDLLFLRSLRPDYLVCAFDCDAPTFRTELYPDYKAHRGEMPDDLQLQLPHVPRILEALAVPALAVPGFEADDVLATLARAGAERGLDVFVCTSDKDCRQLIGDRVRLYNLRKRRPFGREELLADWGIAPEQVVDLQTLVGDAVDNVPGVPGIGIKTAAKLLQEYGTLEAIFANVDRIAGAKRQENLRAAAGKTETTRRLVLLDAHVPLTLDWDAWRLHDVDVDRLRALFDEFGFHSLLGQVKAGRPAAPDGSAKRQADHPLPTRADQPPPTQGELFPFGANAPAGTDEPNGAAVAPRDAWPHTYHLVDTAKEFQGFLKQLREQKRIAFDLETTSLQPLEAEIVGIAFAWKAGEAWYLALRGPEGSALLDAEKTLQRLRPILEDPAVAKVNQNIKYDLLVLRAHGLSPQGVAGDPMVADYLLHAGERSHNLEDLARRYLHHAVIPITDLIGKKGRKQPQRRMDEVPTDRVAEYSGEDADVAWRLCELLEAQLSQMGNGEWGMGNETQPQSAADASSSHSPFPIPHSPLRRLYDEVEIPLIEVLAELEYNGVRLDVPLLERLSVDMAKQMAEIEQEIYELAGRPFNIGSLVQLRQVLFDELKLPVQSRTGITNAPSTDQETLEKLAALEHPGARLPRKILEHRRIAKLKSTYVDALPALVNPKTGRVHASFNQTVAATGRLSSSDPNLQNVPVRREQGQQIRQAFVPEPGWLLLTADYSQIELRLLAHFCGDEALRRAFAEGHDIHAAVAAQIFGVSEDLVTSEMRRMAKTVNFGVIYGISAVGLAQRLEIPRDAAAKFIAAYFGRYPRVEEYQSRLLRDCRRRGFVATLLGRRRAFDPTAIREDSTFASRNQAEREAINMQVQGSAADVIKLAMLHVHRRLRREGRAARMLLQIHDELVFEVPPEELPAVAALVREEMTVPVERGLGLQVPLVVDLAAGPNWLDVENLAAPDDERRT